MARLLYRLGCWLTRRFCPHRWYYSHAYATGAGGTTATRTCLVCRCEEIGNWFDNPRWPSEPYFEAE